MRDVFTGMVVCALLYAGWILAEWLGILAIIGGGVLYLIALVIWAAVTSKGTYNGWGTDNNGMPQ